jgi:hypothetical protein
MRWLKVLFNYDPPRRMWDDLPMKDGYDDMELHEDDMVPEPPSLAAHYAEVDKIRAERDALVRDLKLMQARITGLLERFAVPRLHAEADTMTATKVNETWDSLKTSLNKAANGGSSDTVMLGLPPATEPPPSPQRRKQLRDALRQREHADTGADTGPGSIPGPAGRLP